MTRQAVKEFFPSSFPVFVDPIEVENGPALPTANLMDRLTAKYRESHSVYFVMGSDLIKTLHKWQDGQRMINEVPLVVFRRKGEAEEEKELASHPNFPRNNPIFVGDDKSMIGVISSTEVRSRIARFSNRPFCGVAGLVPIGVLNYIL